MNECYHIQNAPFLFLTQLPSSNEEKKSLIQYDSIGHCSSLSWVNGNDIHARGTENKEYQSHPR
jgi:hypothetical protein